MSEYHYFTQYEPIGVSFQVLPSTWTCEQYPYKVAKSTQNVVECVGSAHMRSLKVGSYSNIQAAQIWGHSNILEHTWMYEQYTYQVPKDTQ